MQNPFTKIIKTLKPYKNTIIIPLAKIIGIIILCVVLVKVIGGHETLADYAKKNPEIAYQTPTP